jgi:hypothetical protein
MESLFSMMNQTAESLEQRLKMIKEHLNPSGKSKDFWINIKPFVPELAGLQQQVQELERQTNIPLEWENLDQWLDNVRRHREQTQTKLRMCVSSMGCDLPPPSDLDVEITMMKIFEGHPTFKLAQSVYGPEWFSCCEQIVNLSGIKGSDSDKSIPINKVQPSIEKSASEILHHWQNLQKMKEHGAMDHFKQHWAQLTLPERNIWLQRHFPQLYKFPHPDIYQWIQHSDLGPKGLESRAFMMPLLNVVDLSQGNLLPDLLQTRANLYPNLFLPMDSCSVQFGLWCKALVQLQIEGRMSFSYEVRHGDVEYGIHLEDKSTTNPFLLNPCVGLYQLKAQKLTYDFLVACSSVILDSSESLDKIKLSNYDSVDGGSTSILNQSIQLSFVRPNYIGSACRAC